VQHYTGRLAPAPTGALHLGNARTFLLAWLRKKNENGTLVLRLEDLDHPKVKKDADMDAYRDLQWLGLTWEFGPDDSFGKIERAANEGDTYIQSMNTEFYRQHLSSLIDSGLCYPCICTRRDLDTVQSAPNDGEDVHEKRYPGTCRGRFSSYEDALAAANGREPGWRFAIDTTHETSFVDAFHGLHSSRLDDWSGDFLIARGDKVGYQLAVVLDDSRMGVTEVVRGDDLLWSTHRQLALYSALGLQPPEFCHVPLVVGPDGRRLAKRHGDSRLSGLRLSGKSPARVLGWLAWSFNWVDSFREELTIDDVLGLYDFSKIKKQPVIATNEHLSWMGFPRNT
jgi:Glutamyl- and glutaminyl-tRNA synthetases